MRVFIPLLLLAVSVGVFFLYIDPEYQKIKILRAEEAQYNDALNKSKELQKERDKIKDKFNKIPAEEVDRLEKLLPDNVDNVRLINDLEAIVGRYGAHIRNIKIGTPAASQRDVLGADIAKFGILSLEFSLQTSYKNFLQILRDLEDSLRLVDVTSIGFLSSDNDNSDYNLAIKTYWLK